MTTRKEFLRMEKRRNRWLNRWPLSRKLKAFMLVLIISFFVYSIALKLLGLS